MRLEPVSIRTLPRAATVFADVVLMSMPPEVWTVQSTCKDGRYIGSERRLRGGVRERGPSPSTWTMTWPPRERETVPRILSRLAEVVRDSRDAASGGGAGPCPRIIGPG